MRRCLGLTFVALVLLAAPAGSRRVRAERTATVVARLTKRGRRMARRGRPFSARVRVRLPGEHRDRARRIRVR